MLEPHALGAGIGIAKVEQPGADHRLYLLAVQVDGADRARLAVRDVEHVRCRIERQPARLREAGLLPRAIEDVFPPAAGERCDGAVGQVERPDLVQPGHRNEQQATIRVVLLLGVGATAGRGRARRIGQQRQVPRRGEVGFEGRTATAERARLLARPGDWS